jgi:hypothetical protein
MPTERKHYMEYLLHCFPSKVLSHRQNQCPTCKDMSLRHENTFKITYQNALTMGWRIGYSCRHSIMDSPQVPVRILMQLLEDHSCHSLFMKPPLLLRR